jgi:hypothetical protein
VRFANWLGDWWHQKKVLPMCTCHSNASGSTTIVVFSGALGKHSSHIHFNCYQWKKWQDILWAMFPKAADDWWKPGFLFCKGLDLLKQKFLLHNKTRRAWPHVHHSRFAIYINIMHHFVLLTGSLLPLYGSLQLAVLGLKCYLVSFYFEKLLPIH